MRFYKLLLFLSLNLGLASCGQPGPLYLPEQAAPVHVEPSPAIKPEPKPNPEKNK